MSRITIAFLIFFLSVFSVFSQEKPFTKYYVQEGETLQSISQKLSITPYDLLKLNPDLKDGIEGIKVLIIPNKNYKPTSPENHKDYIENGFLYHKVLPKENFFRLRKQYGASKRILRKHNAILRTEDLKAGQIIKIPVATDFELSETNQEIILNKTKPYLVKPKETKYNISRRYGIDVDKLIELNPQLKDSILKIDEIIKVPNTEAIPDESEDYVTHKVEKGDNFYRLTKQFEITENELIALNPSLEKGLKEGMLIKIPKKSSEYIKVFTPQVIPDKTINAIILLPFMSNNYSVNFEKNRTSDLVSDFYLGAKVALDSLKKMGVSVTIKVFDTQNSKQKIQSIFSALDLSNTDIIIGPMFYSNMTYVAGLLKHKNIPLISPVSKKDHSVILNSKLIQQIPTQQNLTDKIVSYILKEYTDENLVLISDGKKETIPLVNTIKNSLEVLDSINSVKTIVPEKGYINRDVFKETLLENKNNWVVLATKDTVVTRDVINNLGSMPKEYKTTFFALEKGGNFNVHDDINNDLAHINFHYPSYSFIDYNNEATKSFIDSYKKINYQLPSEYAFKGFDVTFDALLRLASYHTINNALEAGNSKRTSTKFEYRKRKAGTGYINSGVYLIKYDGLNLIEVVKE